MIIRTPYIKLLLFFSDYFDYSRSSYQFDTNCTYANQLFVLYFKQSYTFVLCDLEHEY